MPGENRVVPNRGKTGRNPAGIFGGCEIEGFRGFPCVVAVEKYSLQAMTSASKPFTEGCCHRDAMANCALVQRRGAGALRVAAIDVGCGMVYSIAYAIVLVSCQW